MNNGINVSPINAKNRIFLKVPRQVLSKGIAVYSSADKSIILVQAKISA